MTLENCERLLAHFKESGDPRAVEMQQHIDSRGVVSGSGGSPKKTSSKKDS